MITLAEAKVAMADHVDQTVIDEFRRGSFLMDSLSFDNAVSPGTGGSTLVYGYVQLKTPSTASFRQINTDYTPVEALREEKSTKLKIFGGNFEIDRVIAETSGAIDEMSFQMRQKIEGAKNLFHYTVINGDSVTNTDEFDGLDTMLTGSSTEMTTSIDLSTAALMDSNAQVFLDLMDDFVAGLHGKPTMFLGNSKLITKIKGIARRAGYFSQTEDAFGQSVSAWDGIPLVDLEHYYNGTATVPCVPVDATTGATSLYAVQLAQDGFHGVSPLGNNIIKTNLPVLDSPGVMKLGDVEMVAAVVLKDSRKAGVLRGVKIQ